MRNIIHPRQIEYLENFRKSDDELLSEMEEYAKSFNVPILSWDAAAFIEQIIRIKSPRRVLELGTAIAYSTIRIARNLKRKSEIHTVEKSKDNIVIARNFIEKSAQGEKIRIFEGDASEVLPGLKKKYDFIFLDADKEDYKKLFDYSMILLKKGGILFVDNLLWHGFTAAARVPANYKTSTKFIREFNDVFMNHPQLHSTILPVGDGIGLGIKVNRKQP